MSFASLEVVVYISLKARERKPLYDPFTIGPSSMFTLLAKLLPLLPSLQSRIFPLLISSPQLLNPLPNLMYIYPFIQYSTDPTECIQNMTSFLLIYSFLSYAQQHNCEKRLLSSSCLPSRQLVRLSICPRGTIRLPMDRYT